MPKDSTTLVDRRALKVLFDTYWTSTGWRDEQSRSISPDDAEREDLNVLNFERFKWGRVRHDQPLYASLDLQLFQEHPRIDPTAGDVAVFKDLLQAIEAAPITTTSASLEKHLAKVFKSNKAERDIVVGILVVLAIMLLFPILGRPQSRPEQTDLPINAPTRTEVIEAVIARLKESYVLPEVAAQMERAIRARMERGEYNQITSGAALAQTLTSDLREAHNDRHLEVRYRSEPIPRSAGRREPTPEQLERALRFAKSVNFGFERIDRLEGNIGYLRIDGFIPADVGGKTAAAAMNFLAYTDALIFDLRESAGGGDPSMVVFLSTYLFGSEPVHLNDLYWREGDRTHQYWTLPYVPGERYVGKPVYILTSKRTFSAGEEFAYNLQALRRATLIGETTGGGANPREEFRINEHFEIFVPTGRAVNPVTKTNWEGTGVKPDIEAPEAQALRTAHLAALRRSLEAATDERSRERLRGVIERVERQP